MRTWFLVLFALIGLFAAPVAHAGDLPDLVFQAVEGERVSLVREDGWELEGTLVGFSEEDVVLRLEDGKMQVVKRADIAEVRSLGAAPTAEPTPAPAPETARSEAPPPPTAFMPEPEPAFEVTPELEALAKRMDTRYRSTAWMSWTGVGLYGTGALITLVTCIDYCNWTWADVGGGSGFLLAGMGYDSDAYRSSAKYIRQGDVQRAANLLRSRTTSNIIWGATSIGAGSMLMALYSLFIYDYDYYGIFSLGVSLTAFGVGRLALALPVTASASSATRRQLQMAVVPSIHRGGAGARLIARF